MTDPHIGRLLRDAFGRFEAALLAGLRAEGVEDLRPTHNNVLRFLSPGGTRASTLAERSGLTRQALTQIVDDLERLGFVERRPDPADRRAKLDVYTDRGREAFEAARGIIDGIEREWERRVGERRYAALRAALERVLAD